MKFDIIVIGSIVIGSVPGGYVAAIRAVQLGSKLPSWSPSTLAESASIGLYSDKGASACHGNLEATQEELIHTVFPHPTLSEMMHVDAHGRAIHK
jgi:pyruvate/2-oxoglutarate dehydrogenase complex dihydrolipoamide dehydrogenase (E3) component